jgi:hypothetical protein
MTRPPNSAGYCFHAPYRGKKLGRQMTDRLTFARIADYEYVVLATTPRRADADADPLFRKFGKLPG